MWRKEGNSPMWEHKRLGDGKRRKLQKTWSLYPNDSGQKPRFSPDPCVNGCTSWVILQVWTWRNVCGSMKTSQVYQQSPQRTAPGDCPWKLGAAGGRSALGGGAIIALGLLLEPDLLNFTLASRDRSGTLTFSRDNLKEGIAIQWKTFLFFWGFRLLGTWIELDLFSNRCFHVSFG